tara:strand:+ start:364 stop:546 length:183 start_codon:yes stop_codon:yes gene_type:complete
LITAIADFDEAVSCIISPPRRKNAIMDRKIIRAATPRVFLENFFVTVGDGDEKAGWDSEE